MKQSWYVIETDALITRRNVHDIAVLSQLARDTAPCFRESILEEIYRKTEGI